MPPRRSISSRAQRDGVLGLREKGQEAILATLGASGAPQRQKTPTDTSNDSGGSQGRSGGFGSELEMILANRIALAGLPIPERQFRFCPTRRWRADMAYPAAMLLIEVDGGTWNDGRHVRGKGFEADCQKTSKAAALGFRVIRLTRAMIESGEAVALIREALAQPGRKEA